MDDDDTQIGEGTVFEGKKMRSKKRRQVEFSIYHHLTAMAKDGTSSGRMNVSEFGRFL